MPRAKTTNGPSRAAVRISDMELREIARKHYARLSGDAAIKPLSRMERTGSDPRDVVYPSGLARDAITYRYAMRRALKHIEEMNYDAAFETITRALGGKGK